MFDSVHHVTYLVWDLDSVEAYFQKHFGLHPVHRKNTRPGKPGNISYQVGPTILRFSEPARAASLEFDQLRRYGGPVISHIGLAVANLAKRSEDLKESGGGFAQSGLTISPPGGDRGIDIGRDKSCG